MNVFIYIAVIFFPILVFIIDIRKAQKEDIYIIFGFSTLWYFYWFTLQNSNSIWQSVFFIAFETTIIAGGLISIIIWYSRKKKRINS